MVNILIKIEFDFSNFSSCSFSGIQNFMVERNCFPTIDIKYLSREILDNLTDIRLPIKNIWQPDVTLYN